MRRWLAGVVVVSGLVQSGCENGPCADGSDPPKGSCVCESGERLEGADCDACVGASQGGDLGELDSDSVSGKVVAGCETFVAFELTENGTVELALSGTSATVTAVLRPKNDADARGQVRAGANAIENTELVLDKGKYMVTLTTQAERTPFELDVRAQLYDPPEPNHEPGDVPGKALDLGELQDVQTFGGYIGVGDQADFYAFELAKNSTFKFSTSNVEGRVWSYVYRQDDLFDEDEKLLGLESETADSINLERGAYWVRVVPAYDTTSLYTLAMTAEPYRTDEPDEDPGDEDSPYDLGAVSGLVELGGYVGPTDSEDFYSLELANNAEVTFALSHVLGGAVLRFYEEAAIFDSEDYLLPLSSTSDATSDPTPFAAGHYLVRVVPSRDTPTLYELAVNVEE